MDILTFGFEASGLPISGLPQMMVLPGSIPLAPDKTLLPNHKPLYHIFLQV